MGFNVDSTLTGIHSRSERTVRVTRDYDRGRTTKEALDATFESDSAESCEFGNQFRDNKDL